MSRRAVQRRRAVQQTDSSTHADRLVEGLKQADATVREASAYAIRSVPAERTTLDPADPVDSALLVALADEQRGVRLAAARALAERPAPEMMPGFISAAATSSARECALGMLLKQCQDDRSEVREAACYGLAILGDYSAQASLRGLAQNDVVTEVRAAAEYAVFKLDEIAEKDSVVVARQGLGNMTTSEVRRYSVMASVGGRTLPDHLQRRISKLHQKVEENVEGEVNQGEAALSLNTAGRRVSVIDPFREVLRESHATHQSHATHESHSTHESDE